MKHRWKRWKQKGWTGLATKHEQILSYIDSLDVGEKISVRRIAKEMKVSEGTAYRAIKDAENKGFVSTIERVGTIRIEQKKKKILKNWHMQKWSMSLMDRSLEDAPDYIKR